VTKTDKMMQDAVQLNTVKACEYIEQAMMCVQRAWVANPIIGEYADNVLNESEIHLSNILDRLRTIL
jgi:hypothetical protein